VFRAPPWVHFWAFGGAAAADVVSMRFAAGIVAIVWLSPIAGFADDAPTSADTATDMAAARAICTKP